MKTETQAIILTAVVATVSWLAQMSSTVSVRPGAGSVSALVESGGSVPGETLGAAKAAVDGFDRVACATVAQTVERAGEADAMNQRLRARERRSAALERARRIRLAAKERDARQFAARIEALEKENAELVREATKRENTAINVSHATVDQRNRQQWNALSAALSGELQLELPTPPT